MQASHVKENDMTKELTSDEMRQVLSDWIDDTDASAKTRRNILGLFEAVITRAEAAEAEVIKLRNSNAWYADHCKKLNDDIRRLIASNEAMGERIADLESQVSDNRIRRTL